MFFLGLIVGAMGGVVGAHFFSSKELATVRAALEEELHFLEQELDAAKAKVKKVASKKKAAPAVK